MQYNILVLIDVCVPIQIDLTQMNFGYWMRPSEGGGGGGVLKTNSGTPRL